MARTRVEAPVLETPPVIEAPVIEAPVLPPSLEVVAGLETPPVLGDGPFKVRHKENGGEFEVSAEYLAAYRHTLEVI